MKYIRFKYRDEMSNWKWREQECYLNSLQECIDLYGLGNDCEYMIISVEDDGK